MGKLGLLSAPARSLGFAPVPTSTSRLCSLPTPRRIHHPPRRARRPRLAALLAAHLVIRLGLARTPPAGYAVTLRYSRTLFVCAALKSGTSSSEGTAFALLALLEVMRSLFAPRLSSGTRLAREPRLEDLLGLGCRHNARQRRQPRLTPTLALRFLLTASRARESIQYRFPLELLPLDCSVLRSISSVEAGAPAAGVVAARVLPVRPSSPLSLQGVLVD